jgi:hypothetical protein
VTSIDFSSLSVGDELPQLSIDISAKLIVGAAIASRDYQNVHHDKDAAQELGSPDIFMNILTTNGLVGRYVTDWSGPSARLKKVAIKLGAPNYPGDCMVMSGKVAALDAAAATVELEVLGKNQYGNHVIGSVVVEL